MTNHFLQFLSLDRSDPKKFQILQIIAGLLGWTDEQREHAQRAAVPRDIAELRSTVRRKTIHSTGYIDVLNSSRRLSTGEMA